jgi:hypothetical protein
VSSQHRTKLNRLLKNWPKGGIIVSSYLKHFEISRQLVARYVKSQWLQSIGNGSFIKSGETVDWIGGVYALQSQMKLRVHVGGKNALRLLGIQHFLNLGTSKTVWLFGQRGEKLPKWFLESVRWDKSGSKINYITPVLFSDNKVGLEKYYITTDYVVTISSAERALLELLYLVPSEQTLEEAKYIMEGLVTLRPNLLQKLLEQCRVIKVKRLFIFLADLCQLPCLEHLNLSTIDLGEGKRVIGEGGYYISKYQLSLSQNFVNTFQEELKHVK